MLSLAVVVKTYEEEITPYIFWQFEAHLTAPSAHILCLPQHIILRG